MFYNYAVKHDFQSKTVFRRFNILRKVRIIYRRYTTLFTRFPVVFSTLRIHSYSCFLFLIFIQMIPTLSALAFLFSIHLPTTIEMLLLRIAALHCKTAFFDFLYCPCPDDRKILINRHVTSSNVCRISTNQMTLHQN